MGGKKINGFIYTNMCVDVCIQPAKHAVNLNGSQDGVSNTNYAKCRHVGLHSLQRQMILVPPSIHLSLSKKPLRRLDPGTKNVRVFVYVHENRSGVNLDALNNGM